MGSFGVVVKKKQNAARESAQESESLIEFHASYTFSSHEKKVSNAFSFLTGVKAFVHRCGTACLHI